MGDGINIRGLNWSAKPPVPKNQVGFAFSEWTDHILAQV